MYIRLQRARSRVQKEQKKMQVNEKILDISAFQCDFFCKFCYVNYFCTHCRLPRVLFAEHTIPITVVPFNVHVYYKAYPAFYFFF